MTVTVATAVVIVTTMLHVVLTVTLLEVVMTVTAAVVMIVVVVDTLTAVTVVTIVVETVMVAAPVMLHLLHMSLLLVESLVSHTEVDLTMMSDGPVVELFADPSRCSILKAIRSPWICDRGTECIMRHAHSSAIYVLLHVFEHRFRNQHTAFFT